MMEGRALSRPKINGTTQRPSLQNSATNGVSSANAGKHFPKRIENAPCRRAHIVDVLIVDVCGKHFALGRGMFTISFDVDREIFVMLRIGEAVMFLQSIDLRFPDRWDLALVSIKCGQAFRGRLFAAN